MNFNSQKHIYSRKIETILTLPDNNILISLSADNLIGLEHIQLSLDELKEIYSFLKTHDILEKLK